MKVLGKYGVLLYEESGKFKVFTNEKFSGVEMPLNEDISVDINEGYTNDLIYNENFDYNFERIRLRRFNVV